MQICRRPFIEIAGGWFATEPKRHFNLEKSSCCKFAADVAIGNNLLNFSLLPRPSRCGGWASQGHAKSEIMAGRGRFHFQLAPPLRVGPSTRPRCSPFDGRHAERGRLLRERIRR